MILHSWSGGKDSTAAIILDHIHNLPPSTIIFSEVMFDRHRGISGEHPEHIRFVKDIAIPRFREWGYTVEVLHADSDYIENFHRVIQKSKIPERNGKIRGFPIGGRCAINRDIKIKAIKDYLKRHEGRETTQYVGIAADEPRRLARLEGTNRISLLARYGYTEKMAYNLCAQYGLLSPLYEMSSNLHISNSIIPNCGMSLRNCPRRLTAYLVFSNTAKASARWTQKWMHISKGRKKPQGR